MHEDLLVDYLPKAGLIFPARLRLLSNGERDAVVSGVFRSAGMIKASPTKAEFARGQQYVEAFLVDLFFNAANEAYKPLIQSEEALDFESTLRENTWWVKGDRIGSSIFAELFHSLVDAHPAQHSALGREIEKFLTSQENWGRARANMAFFEMAGGFVQEDDDDNDEAQGDKDDGGSSSEDSDEDGAPITGIAEGAGVAAAIAFGDAVRAATTADDQGDVRALVPQFSAMDMDEEGDGAEEDEEGQAGQTTEENGNDAMRIN